MLLDVDGVATSGGWLLLRSVVGRPSGEWLRERSRESSRVTEVCDLLDEARYDAGGTVLKFLVAEDEEGARCRA